MDYSGDKLRFTSKSKFYGSLLLQTELIETDKIATAGVSKTDFYVNPEFWKGLNDDEKDFIFAHEMLHLALKHPFRAEGHEELAQAPDGQVYSVWNIATDYVTNGILVKEGKYNLLSGSLFDSKYDDKTAEEVYQILCETLKKNEAPSPNGKAGDHSKWGEKPPNGKSNKDAEKTVEGRVQNAIKRAREKGEESALFDRLTDSYEPKEDWRKLLIDLVQPFKDDYSFSPCDRRYLEEEFILPDIQDGQKLDYIVVAIDTSGSIGEAELGAFLGEIKGILQAFDKVKVKLTFCDAEATPFVELEEWEPSKIKPKGGGGTDFEPVFELVKKEESEPLGLFYFTDLYGSFPSYKPDYPVTWVVLEYERSGEKPPFGKVLPYKIQ